MSLAKNFQLLKIDVVKIYFACLIFVVKVHCRKFFNGKNFPNYSLELVPYVLYSGVFAATVLSTCLIRLVTNDKTLSCAIVNRSYKSDFENCYNWRLGFHGMHHF